MRASSTTSSLDEILINHALESPFHRFLLRPVYDDVDTPVEGVTYGVFNMHVSRLARTWSTERTASGAQLIQPRDVVGVFFPSGYTLCVVLFAILRLGAIPFCISPRNSDPALRYLIQKGNVAAIIAAVDDNLLSRLQDSLSHHDESSAAGVPILGVARSELADLPTPSESQYFPLLCSGTGDDVAIQQHTSGSTAFPKPVPLTHKLLIRSLCGGTWWVDDFHNQCDITLGQPPVFHMFGLIGGLLNSLYRGHTFALPPIPKSDNGGLFPAPQTLRRYALRIGATEFFGVSNSVVGFARSEGGIDLLKSLKRVLVAGAPMPRDNGDWIVEHGVHLVEGVGSTEGGSLLHSNRPRGDPAWQGMQVCWNVTHHFEPFGPPPHTLYELILHSSELSGNFPGADPGTGHLRTHDLFQEWPKPGDGRWKHCGRSDDILLLSTGQNWNPRPMELQIEAFSVIKHAVVFGQARPGLGVLIALHENLHVDGRHNGQVSAIPSFHREAIWEAVQAANSVAPHNARIDRNRVLVLASTRVYLLDGSCPISGDDVKAIPTADKGTPLRPKTYEFFKYEIDYVYNSTD